MSIEELAGAAAPGAGAVAAEELSPPDGVPAAAEAEAVSVDGFAVGSHDEVEAVVARAEPVAAAERFASVNTIRGVAVLGILAMNIVSFAWPHEVYSTPTLDPDATWVDNALWGVNHVLFDTKMMTLFSMLFGAGLVLMSDRAAGRGATIRGVYYRRVTWLLIIGLIHAYFIWMGDILVMYASCGYLLYLFRNLRPRTLIITGVCFNLVFVPLLLGFRFAGIPFMRATAEQVEAEAKEGKKAEGWRKSVAEGYREMTKPQAEKREDFLARIAVHRGPYLGLVRDRAKQLVWGQTLGFLLGGWWLAGGRMLIGMGLMKLGVFSAERSTKFYAWMMLLGYGVGLPVVGFDTYHLIANDFFVGRGLEYAIDGWWMLNFYGSLAVVVGHIGLVMLIVKSGLLASLTRRLAAVGRMALSNYLFDSIVCTTIFYGYGFDLFGAIHRPMLYGLVLAIWAFQLWFSPIWLSRFRFGPAEWLWRSLTYWRFQPMRPRAEMAMA